MTLHWTICSAISTKCHNLLKFGMNPIKHSIYFYSNYCLVNRYRMTWIVRLVNIYYYKIQTCNDPHNLNCTIELFQPIKSWYSSIREEYSKNVW